MFVNYVIEQIFLMYEPVLSNWISEQDMKSRNPEARLGMIAFMVY